MQSKLPVWSESYPKKYWRKGSSPPKGGFPTLRMAVDRLHLHWQEKLPMNWGFPLRKFYFPKASFLLFAIHHK